MLRANLRAKPPHSPDGNAKVREMLDNISTGVKSFVDSISLITVVGTLTNLLPAVAAVLSIFWTVIRIYETKTVQKLLGRQECQDGAKLPVNEDAL
jgi:hypothetical protein